MAQMVKAAGQRQHWKEAIVMFDEMQAEVITAAVGPFPVSPLARSPGSWVNPAAFPARKSFVRRAPENFLR